MDRGKSVYPQVEYRSNIDSFQDGIPCESMKYFNEFPIYLSYILV